VFLHITRSICQPWKRGWYRAKLPAGRRKVRTPAGARELSLLKDSIRTGPAAHAASYSMGARELFPGVKRLSPITQFYLVSRLRISGGVPPHPLHAHAASIGATLLVTQRIKLQYEVQITFRCTVQHNSSVLLCCKLTDTSTDPCTIVLIFII
jgi:hypothetical protein